MMLSPVYVVTKEIYPKELSSNSISPDVAIFEFSATWSARSFFLC